MQFRQEWAPNEKGLSTKIIGRWRFTVVKNHGFETDLWQYCVVSDDGVEFSHFAPSEQLAKDTAELHAKMGKMPPIGIIALATSEDGYFDIVGESHYQDALEGIAGPKGQSGSEFQTEAIIIPDPDNPHDCDAIMVVIEDQTVGHIPRDQTAELHEFLAQVGASSAVCEAVIEGGWKNSRSEGSYCVRLNMEWPPNSAE